VDNAALDVINTECIFFVSVENIASNDDGHRITIIDTFPLLQNRELIIETMFKHIKFCVPELRSLWVLIYIFIFL
jgi:hypothetical protein